MSYTHARRKFVKSRNINSGFELRFFDFHLGSWPEWDSNPQPRAYRAHALTTEISGQTMRRASF